MKHLKVFLTMAIAVFSFTALNAQKTKIKTKNSIAVADSVYQCPMKCEGEKTFKKAGKCPVCNMKLKPMPKPAAITYQCPMKCEGDKTYDKAGKCPVCNMNLKAKEANVAKVQYQCPMKCEGDKTYSKEGKCPVCNMALKKVKTEKVKESHDGHNHN